MISKINNIIIPDQMLLLNNISLLLAYYNSPGKESSFSRSGNLKKDLCTRSWVESAADISIEDFYDDDKNVKLVR